MRQLLNGLAIDELPKPVHLAVITRCPWKYTLIDNETGRVYTGSDEDNVHLPGYVLWKEVK